MKAHEKPLICEGCGKHVTASQRKLSLGRFGKVLCWNCQIEEMSKDK